MELHFITQKCGAGPFATQKFGNVRVPRATSRVRRHFGSSEAPFNPSFPRKASLRDEARGFGGLIKQQRHYEQCFFTLAAEQVTIHGKKYELYYKHEYE